MDDGSGSATATATEGQRQGRPAKSPKKGKRTHTCVICHTAFQQQNPKIEYSGLTKEDIFKRAKDVDEFNIIFVLERCLGVSAEDIDSILSELVEEYGEPEKWALSFCPQHNETIQKAVENAQEILRLQDELDQLKMTVKNSISYNLAIHRKRVSDLDNQALKNFVNVFEKAISSSTTSTSTSSTPKPKKKNKAGSKGKNKTKSPTTRIEAATEAEVMDIDVKEESDDELQILDNVEESPPGSPSAKNPRQNALESESTSSRVNSPRKKQKNSKAEELKRAKPSDSQIPTPESSFKCRSCPRKFPNISVRDKHRMEEHGLEPLPSYNCDKCSRSFNVESNLQYHVQKFHAAATEAEESALPSLPKLSCNHCPRTYTSTEALEIHTQLFHPGTQTLPERPLHETQTHHLRNNRDNEDIGQRSNESQEDLERVHCQPRRKSVPTRRNLSSQSVEVEPILSNMERPKCDICCRRFVSDRNLHNHKLTQHYGLFKYKCQVCGIGSLYRSQHVAHMEKHHGISIGKDEHIEIQNNTDLSDLPTTSTLLQNGIRNQSSQARASTSTNGNISQLGTAATATAARATTNTNILGHRSQSSQFQTTPVMQKQGGGRTQQSQSLSTRASRFSTPAHRPHPQQTRGPSKSKQNQTPTPTQITPPKPNEDIREQLRHLLRNDLKFKCFQCDGEFSSSAELHKHKRHCIQFNLF